MDILDSVLMYGKPREWEPASYEGTLYQSFDLQPGDPEYIAEVRPFEQTTPRITVTSLKRYQNPTLLGRFKIRKDQLISRQQYIQEVKYYHPLSRLDLSVALEFNMDVRRYTNRGGGIFGGGANNPTFYQTPGTAYSAISGKSDKVILICNILCRGHEAGVISKDNDAEYMPTYVAEVI